MTPIRSPFTSNDAPANAAAARHRREARTAPAAAVMVMVMLLACQHPRTDMKSDSAAIARSAERTLAQNPAEKTGADNGKQVADEWQSCDSSDAVCSATRDPTGAEVMESAAPQPRSVLPARTAAIAREIDAATAANAAGEATSAHARGAHGSPSSRERSKIARNTAPALAALNGVSTETHYWYAWLALLALLLVVWWWSRRRPRIRVPSTTQLASATTAQSAIEQATEDDRSRPGLPQADDVAFDADVDVDADADANLDADAGSSGSVVVASVPMRRLTFAAVGATDDAIDREIALPRRERAAATPVKLQLVQSSTRHSPEAALFEAKRLLAAARPEDALRILEPVLGDVEPPSDAWIVAGWAWWRLAHENEGATAYVQAGSAAESFAQALRNEPSRADLMTRLARSHLLRAQYAASDVAREQSFDKAFAYLDQRSQARTDEPADHLDLAQAALQRAQASEHEGDAARHLWLTRAQHHLSAVPATHTLLQDGPTKALVIDVQLGLAASAKGEASARLYRQAIGQLQTALADADEPSVDVWLAKLINATRELIHHQSGGSRLLTLQSLKAEVTPYLQRTHAVTPLLSWINLLDEWSRLLPARAAQAKLAEADHLFERASQMNSQGPSGILFARAYYLRTRSQHEQGANRLRTLMQAREILQAIPADALPASIMKMETAEMELALAQQADGISAPEHYRHAVMFASQAAATSARPVMAWRCAAQALLGLSRHTNLDGEQHAKLLGLAGQLEEGGAGQPAALRTAAEIRLSAGEFASSSRLCEAAWNAGASRLDVLPLWQEADARWARTLEHANQDAAWRHMHQRLRLASTSY